MAEDTDQKFSDEDKRVLVNAALSNASKVLMSAVVMAEISDFITGDVVFPGEKWRLRFERLPNE